MDGNGAVLLDSILINGGKEGRKNKTKKERKYERLIDR